MATYIQGLTDYIPQIQPFQPDLNFYGNVMQTRQTRFDAATKKINDLYGSLLYAPLSRESNIKRREEFFNVIDNDIKRIAGLDLSLKQNEDQALAVFKGFTDDKYMLSDMVKTKNAHAELQRGENFKYCTDKEKCGGEYWDAGMQKLYYKLDEFKKVSDEESLNFQIGSYDPYYDWKKDAAKKAKEQGYDVSVDSISGNWIVKDSGGKLVQGGLYNFFKTMYGDDPRVQSNYDTQAYVARKNYVKSTAAQFGSEEEAEKDYIMKNINGGLKNLNDDLTTTNKAYDQLTSRINQLEQKKKKGWTARDKEAYDLAVQQKESVSASKSSLQSRIDAIQKNIDTNDINSLRQRSDSSVAAAYERSDMEGLAKSLADMKQTHEIKGANPYALAAYNNKLAKDLAKHNAGLDIEKMKIEYGLKMELEDHKAGVATGAIPSEAQTIEGAPQGIVDLKATDNPTVVFERNRSRMHEKMAEANTATNNMLFNMFVEAKKNVTANPTKSAGARQFLEQFGDKWNEIRNVEDLKVAMNNKKLLSNVVFKTIMNHANQDNNPTGDYEWAQKLIKSSAADIDKVKVINDAYHATLNHNLGVNKTVVDKIKATTTKDNPVAKYADLVLTQAGFLLGDDDASKKIFIDKYKAAKAKEGSYVSNSQAEDAFDSIKEQFFDTYNRTEGVSLDQAPGQSGGGIVQANAVEFRALDSGNKGNKGLQDIVRTADKALTNLEASSTVVFGNASADALDEGDNDKARDFVNKLLIAVKTANPKKDDRPKFNAVVSPIAANTEGMSAITFKDFNPDFIKDYVGTKDAPGPLWQKDLSKGITLFYDNTTIESPFKTGSQMGALETTLLTKKHYTIDSFKDDVGTVDFEYNDLTHSVDGVIKYKDYNMNTHKWEDKVENIPAFSVSDSDRIRDIYIEKLKTAQAQNIYIENALAQANKS